MFGVVIGEIVGAFDPMEAKLALGFSTSEPMDLHEIILMQHVMIVLFTNPTAVELSVWMGDFGCGQPISASVLRMGTISRAVM